MTRSSRTGAARAAFEAATSQFSTTANTARDAEDDGEDDEGTDDYRNNDGPSGKLLAIRLAGIRSEDTYLQYVFSMHLSHEERVSLASASGSRGASRVRATRREAMVVEFGSQKLDMRTRRSTGLRKWRGALAQGWELQAERLCTSTQSMSHEARRKDRLRSDKEEAKAEYALFMSPSRWKGHKSERGTQGGEAAARGDDD